MKRTIVVLSALILMAIPAHGATVGAWTHAASGAGGSCRVLKNGGDRCFYNSTGAGNSPIIEATCAEKTLTVTGTLSVNVYKCRDGTFANCKAFENINDRTGIHGAVVLGATDWYSRDMPFPLWAVEWVSGSGEAVFECGD